MLAEVYSSLSQPTIYACMLGSTRNAQWFDQFDGAARSLAPVQESCCKEGLNSTLPVLHIADLYPSKP